jgi:integrase
MDERGITQNSRNVYYRNIRSVFNEALDEELTHNYPFRKFKLKKVVTRKRSLTVEELRMLRDYPCEEWQEKFRDIFMLMFYLCGINAADLYPAKKKQVRKGRLEYERAKTYKGYSVKIEPEAQRIIDKYRGDEYLLKFCEGDKDYKYFLQRMSRELKKIGPYTKKGLGGKKIHKPLFPELTQYWCRHTWATIAAELDIPKETIAAALGHDMGNSTTAIYINFNQKKVDEANRRVIDFLNEK